MKQFAYNYLIPLYSEDRTDGTGADKEGALRLCNEAISDLPGFIDYNYYRAILNNQNGNYKAAQDDLEICERALLSTDAVTTTHILMSSPILLFHQLRISAKGLGDESGIIRNTTIIQAMLTEGKDETGITGAYIRAMLIHGATDDEVLNELGSIYDLKSPKDILSIARAAKEAGAIDFTRKVMEIANKSLGEEN